MLTALPIGLASGLLFAFVYWRGLKEDFSAEQIFSSVLYILAGMLFGLVSSLVFAPKWWFWMTFAGSCLGLIASIVKFDSGGLEVIESWVLSSLYMVTLLIFYYYIVDGGELLGVLLFLGTLTIAFFHVIDRYYDRFVWYKSGRIGFTGLTTLGVFFIIRAIVAVIFGDVISFVGEIDAIASSLIAFLAFLSVFNLSRRDK